MLSTRIEYSWKGIQ